MTGANTTGDRGGLRRHVPRRITVLLPVVGLAVLALCGLVVFGLATVRVGVVAVVIGGLAAMVPVAIVTATLLWIDRWEPEPARLLLLTFAWGACVATLSALLINDTAAAVGDVLLGAGHGNTLSTLVSAPLVEEAMKALPVLALFWWRSKELDGTVDGIVYAGFAAAGFAFTENIYYFGRAFAEYGLGDATSPGVIAAFIMRGVLSPFAHPLFTVLTGIAIGLAARSGAGKAVKLLPLAGYLAAVGLHALWNGAATIGGADTFLNVYFLIMVPIFLGVAWLVVWQRRREQAIIAAELPELVEGGWIAQPEVELLASLQGRRDWRNQAAEESGAEAAKAVAAYQAAVTELAFLRHRGRKGADVRTRHAALVEVLRATREKAVRLANG